VCTNEVPEEQVECRGDCGSVAEESLKESDQKLDWGERHLEGSMALGAVEQYTKKCLPCRCIGSWTVIVEVPNRYPGGW
jgi:hypothetical protein